MNEKECEACGIRPDGFTDPDQEEYSAHHALLAELRERNESLLDIQQTDDAESAELRKDIAIKNDWLKKALAERDALRAENERLREMLYVYHLEVCSRGDSPCCGTATDCEVCDLTGKPHTAYVDRKAHRALDSKEKA